MMFRHLYLAAFVVVLLHSVAHADGLPYTTGEAGQRAMSCDFIALRISSDQIEEVSKSGVISFEKQQLKKLRVYYPKFPATAGVASSTFNDNLERFEIDVDVIWWFADEVRIPLFASDKGEVGMPGSDPWSVIDVLVRIAPDGTPYRDGLKTSYREVLAAIDLLAAKPAHRPNERPSLRVMVPPPHRGWAETKADVLKDLLPEDAGNDPNKVIPRVFQFLEAYARARGVELFKSW